MSRSAVRSLVSVRLLVAAGSLLAAPALATLPTGGVVEAGAASLTQGANALTIQQSSDRLRMSWDSFSIGAGNTVDFRQPSASSFAVNLVRGGDASVIAGNLTANGRVVLVNPQGVAFTGSAQVNVGSLVASALRDASGDFTDGRTTLSGPGGEVANAGIITVSRGGSAVLAGARVTNTGHILADAGKVALAAGGKVSLDFSGDGLISLAVDEGAVDAAVTNGGAIRVGSGHILLTAKSAESLASSVVRNTGELQASAIVERGGEIWLTADVVESSGTVAATSVSGQGGEAHLVGRQSVSVTGTVDVTGGAKGGFVDVSAPAVLLPSLFQISVGRGGKFLLDPDNITIDAVGSPIVGNPTSSIPATDISLSKFSIQTWLSGGADLEIEAVSNITVQSSIIVGTPGAGNLTLTAGNDIDILRPISTTGGLALDAGNDIDVSADLTAASLSVIAGRDLLIESNILTTDGDLDLQVAGDLYLDDLGGLLTLQSFDAFNPLVAGDILTNIPLILGGTEFVVLTDAGATLAYQGWLVSAHTDGASLLTLAGDVRMQYGFGSGNALPTAAQLAFVPVDGVKYPDLYMGQLDAGGLPETNGLRTGDTLADVFDFPNLAVAWTAGAPTATAAAGSTFGYTLSLGAGFDIKKPGYIVALAENTGTLTVRPRELLVKPDSLSGTYGDFQRPSKFLYQVTGFQNGDNVVSLGITGEALTNSLYDHASPANRGAGEYAITITKNTLTDPSSANYALNLQPGMLTIAKAPLNISADNKSRVYGEANPEFDYTVDVSDLRYGETAGSVFTGAPALSTVAGVLSGAGTYDIVADDGSLVLLSPNYDILLSDGILTVTKAPLTLKAGDVTREYGLPNTEITFTSSVTAGFKNGQNALTAGISGAAAYSTTALAGSPVGDYNVNVSKGTLVAANYEFVTFLPGTLTVTKAPLTVTAQNATREYGLPNSSVTFTYVVTGLRNGDLASVVTGSPTISTAATQLDNVGNYAITVGAGTLAAANYDIAFLSNGSLTIAPATSLVITANNQRRIYGDPNTALVGEYTVTGFRNSDTLLSSGITGLAAVTYAPAVTATSNAGNYNIAIARGTLADGAPSNYDLTAATYVPGVLTIDKAPVSLVADTKTKTYGEVNPGLTYTLSGLRNGETQAGLVTAGALTGSPVLATSATTQSNAGTYDITISRGTLSATNYEFAPLTNGTLTIRKRALTVSANAQTREYGSPDQYVLGSDASYTIDGFSFSQTAAGLRLSGDLTGSPDMTTNALITSDVGAGYAVNISKGTLSATNYDFDTSSFNGAIYTITKAPITVSASDKSRLYGDPNPSLEYTLSGFKLGETTFAAIGATGLPVLTTAVTQQTDVGSYPVTVNVAGISSTNYSFVADDGVLTIDKAPLTLKVDDATTEYGSDFAGFTLTMTGFKNGQTQAGLRTAGTLSGDATYTYTNAQVKNLDVAGSPYSVAATAIGTLDARNYSFSVQTPPAGTGQLTITPAPITLKATDITRTYGDAWTQAQVDAQWDIVGLKNGQTRDGLVTAGVITSGPTVTSALAIDALTGAGSYIGAVTVSPVGFTFAGTPNYSLDPLASTTSANLTVGKAGLTVGLLDTPLTKVYGTANPTFSPTYSGFKNGQDIASIGLVGAPTFSTTATTSSNVGSYAVTVNVDGLSSDNYSFSGSSGVLNITKAPLTVSADAKTRQYGLSNPTLTATLTGFVLGQNLGTSGVTGSAALSTAATPTSSVAGSPYPITVALGTLASANYDFTAFNDSTLTITKAPLTIAADAKTKVYGDVNPALTYTVNGLRQSDTAAVILGGTPTVSTTVTQLTGAGTYTGAITADITGLTADNYTIGASSGTFTVQKATLVGKVDDASRSFGYPNPTFTVTWEPSGFRNGDTATTSGFSGAIAFSTDANPASPVAGSPYTVAATAGTYTSPNYTFGTIAPGILTVDRGNLWENEAYNLAAAPLASAIRLDEVQSRLLGQPLSRDPQASIDFDKFSIRLSITPPATDKDNKKPEPSKPAADAVSKN